MPKGKSRRRLNKHLDKCTDPCSICLAAMDPKCQCYYKLECGHAFHSSCLLSWYRKCNDVDLQVVIPYSDLDLQFFFGDCNCMSCPLCKTEYCKEMIIDQVTGKVSQKNTNLKKILGKINMLYCHEGTRCPVVATHYVINPDVFDLFIPALETQDDNGDPMVFYTRRK